MNEVSSRKNRRIAILGGGPAGLAAAVTLVNAGVAQEGAVELFEATGRLGGRAATFLDGPSGVTLDTCQHVLMGCCTATIDFFTTLGLRDRFTVYDRYHFYDAAGKCHDFAATRGLPAALHLLPGFWRLKYLKRSDRLRIIRSLMRLRRLKHDACTGRTIGDWLRAEGHSREACERFWAIVLTGALSETLDRASLQAARKVFVDGFLCTRDAYRLWVPREPLGEIFDRAVGAWLQERGIVLHRGLPVRRLVMKEKGTGSFFPDLCAIETSDGQTRPFDQIIAAVPWHRFQRILEVSPVARDEIIKPPGAGDRANGLEYSPITAAHLWFDRPVSGLPHAVLVDQRGNWMFRPPWAEPNYAQVVISESRDMFGLDREARDAAVRQIAAELVRTVSDGKSPEPKLVRHHTITHPRAVFSVTPESDRCRPGFRTSIENLYLAGDWTATGWPSTIEGAIRSGKAAGSGPLLERGPA